MRLLTWTAAVATAGTIQQCDPRHCMHCMHRMLPRAHLGTDLPCLVIIELSYMLVL